MTDKISEERGQIFTLLDILFRRFASEEQIDTSDLRWEKIKNFYQWCHVQLGPLVDTDEVAQKLAVLLPEEDGVDLAQFDDSDKEALVLLVQSPFVLAAVMSDWWGMLAVKEPPAEVRVKGISLTVNIQYDDEGGPNKEGNVLSIPMVTTADQQATPLSTGVIISLFKGSMNRFLRVLMQHGTDGIWRQMTSGSAEFKLDSKIPASHGGPGF